MSKTVEKDAKIVTYVMHGLFSGLIAGIVWNVIVVITPLIVPGSFNWYDFISRPRASVYTFVIHMVFALVLGIMYGIVMFFLITRAGWKLDLYYLSSSKYRDLKKHAIVGLVYGVGIWIVVFSWQLDSIVDDTIQLIAALVYGIVLGLVFFFEPGFEFSLWEISDYDP